ncbi:haloacid dehalogenase [Phlebopus sp. FC_14]|nr:haloacid dehalogenase [Phlebopus sp. FC_14]
MADPSPSTPNLNLTDHRVLIFDVYGTLVDWETAIYDALKPVLPDLSREEILTQYGNVEGNLQMQFPSTAYSKILELAFRQLSTRSGIIPTGFDGGGEASMDQNASTSEATVETVSSPSIPAGDAERFGASIADWKPFADTTDALHRLKKHFALVVLSNVDNASFKGTHARLSSSQYEGSAYRTVAPDSPFSLILTAQQVGTYKPNPLMLETALRQLSANPDRFLPSNPSVRVEPSQVLVVANSIRHDILPSLQRGLRNVWISRYGVNYVGNKGGSLEVGITEKGGAADGRFPYTWRFETLEHVADTVEQEVANKT